MAEYYNGIPLSVDLSAGEIEADGHYGKEQFADAVAEYFFLIHGKMMDSDDITKSVRHEDNPATTALNFS